MPIPDEMKQQILADKEVMREIITAYLKIKTPRDNEVRFRVSQAEEARLLQSAQDAGKTVSEYIRGIVLA